MFVPRTARTVCHASVLALLCGLKQQHNLNCCQCAQPVLWFWQGGGWRGMHSRLGSPLPHDGHRFPAHLALVKHFHGILVWVVPASWAHTVSELWLLQGGRIPCHVHVIIPCFASMHGPPPGDAIRITPLPLLHSPRKPVVSGQQQLMLLSVK